MVLLGILLVYATCWLGTLIRNNMKKNFYIGQADRQERTILVSGLGKVTGSNDIAVTTIGHSNTDKDVAKAQAANKKVMDKVLAELKQLGVADKDLQSDYSIYPDYNYTEQKGQELRGYRVASSVTVKIRDLSKISAILGLAGKYGATEVGGLSFTIDAPENLKANARAKAVADAQAKAAKLAAGLGVRLGALISYNEYESGGYQPMPMMKYGADMGGGMGGGPAEVMAGGRDVMMNVNLSYEILP